MSYAGKLDLKLKAQKLRKRGLSVKEIEKKLKVSRSSVSLWIREVKLTKKQLKKLYLNKKTGQLKGSIIAAMNKIKIREEAILSGRNARSVIKTRAGIKDNATSEVYNVTEGNAPYVRGHVDCIEIVSGNAKAKATPIVSVSDETARVTHEAAIGSVDKKQLETLLSHGLSRKEAVDAIIKGMLR